MDKEQLFNYICCWYGYWFSVDNDGTVTDCTTDGEDTISHQYKNIDDALKGWLDTLKADMKENRTDWSEEIEFIQSLK